MCEGRASFTVDHDGVEGACSGREVLPVGLLMRPRLNHGQSCEWVTSLSTNTDGGTANAEMIGGTRDSVEGRRHLI